MVDHLYLFNCCVIQIINKQDKIINNMIIISIIVINIDKRQRSKTF